MKTKRNYLVTCATGHVGDRVARGLLALGHSVRALARDKERLQPLAKLGASICVGDMHDEASVMEAFRGVDAALLACKGDAAARDYRRDFALAGENYAKAAKATGLKSAVFVSSLGAHDERYRGLVLIHGDVEHSLNQVPGLNLINLRAPIFFEDLLYFLYPMNAFGALTWPIASDAPLDMGSTRDIADVAVERLAKLDFEGKRAIELHGLPGVTVRKIGQLISEAIGRPMPARPSSKRDDVEGMVAAGMGRDFALLMNEAWETFSEGLIRQQGLPGSIVLPQEIGEFIREQLAPALLATPAQAAPAAAK